MPSIGPSPLEAFQIGQQLRGPSALGQFAMAMTKRAIDLNMVREEAKAKAQAEIETAGPIAEAKAAAEAKHDPFSRMIFGDEGAPAGGAGDGFSQLRDVQNKLPPGVTLKNASGTINIQRPEHSNEVQKQIINTQSALRIVDKLDAMAEPLKQLPAGQMAATKRNLSSWWTGGKANPELRVYENVSQADAIGLYKNLTGDTRVAASEALRAAYPYIWRPWEGEPWEGVGQVKMEKMREALQRRAEFLKSGNYQVDQYGQLITPISDLFEEGGPSTMATGDDDLVDLE